MSLNVLFMGTPDFSIPTLNMLINNFSDFKISVITMPDKIRGRGRKVTPSPVKEVALSNELAVFTPLTKEAVTECIQTINPDLIIVVAYGMIIEKKIVDQYFCINIHASVLPKYRGASPIQSALLNGEKSTGVTVIKLNEDMDAGDILYIQEVDIEDDDDHGVLSKKLSLLGSNSCFEFIKNHFIPNEFLPVKQDHSKATYCKKILKDSLLIESSMDSVEIFRKIKAFSPKPAAYYIQNNKRIKLLSSRIIDGKLFLLKIQPEGKAPMLYTDYLLGYPEGVDIHGK